MGGRHTLHAHRHHLGWDRRFAPALRVAPGDRITFETVDSSGGQIDPHSDASRLAGLDFGRLNPVTGPVYVDGAEPGDALVIEIEHFAPTGWGWTAIIPGFGLLADQFSEPALHQWRLDPTLAEPAMFGRSARVPLRPFAGTIGLAPAAPGPHGIVPPRRVGGNLDIRDLVAGATLVLPVEVPGALLSIGDTHAAQGDGEVCGTAIESPMTVSIRVGLEKGAAPPSPQALVPAPDPRREARGHVVTTGIGPDLWGAARDAVRSGIDRMVATHGIAPEEAYMLASVAGDLRIAEIVDLPNVVVALHMPRALFD